MVDTLFCFVIADGVDQAARFLDNSPLPLFCSIVEEKIECRGLRFEVISKANLTKSVAGNSPTFQ